MVARTIGRVGGAFQPQHVLADPRADPFLKQRLLVLEPEINRALCDVGAARDILDTGGGETPFAKLLQRLERPGNPQEGAQTGHS